MHTTAHITPPTPPTPPTPLDVRPLQAADTPAMLQLFQAVFGHAMSPAFHAWKYRAGAGCALGVFREGELVAHYGGVGAEICYFGRPARAVQIVDVMVKAAERKAVRKGSPFFRAGSAFLEHFIGYDHPYLLGYGFPSDRHMALAAHLGLYAPVGRMWELNWPVDAGAKAPGLLHSISGLDASNIAGCTAKLDALWNDLRQDMKHHIVVQKDAAHIERRYLHHPDNTYRLCLLSHRLTRRPLGLIVLKQDPQNAHKMLLMDYVGALANLPAALKLALYEARRAGCRDLSTWCSESFVATFRNASPAVASATQLPITTPANIWTEGPQPAQLHNRWWLQPGDTDFL